MTCNGICERYQVKKPANGGRYANGQKRCQVCEIFIGWEGLWCPCCNYRLRTKPRNKEYKAKLLAMAPKFGDRVKLYVKNSGINILAGEGILIKQIKSQSYSDMELWHVETDSKYMVARFIQPVKEVTV